MESACARERETDLYRGSSLTRQRRAHNVLSEKVVTSLNFRLKSLTIHELTFWMCVHFCSGKSLVAPDLEDQQSQTQRVILKSPTDAG